MFPIQDFEDKPECLYIRAAKKMFEEEQKKWRFTLQNVLWSWDVFITFCISMMFQLLKV